MVASVETGPRFHAAAVTSCMAANATDHAWTIEELLNAGRCWGVKCEFVGRKLGISAHDHQGSREILICLEDALECNEAECTAQEAEASTPHRQMVVSGKGQTAVPKFLL
jgi:hypothetical protein